MQVNLFSSSDQRCALSSVVSPPHRCLLQGGVTHSLDFPIDTEYSTPRALDVLTAACVPVPSDRETFTDRESLFYPLNLPLTTSLELANHPVLDAVRSTLFPN